MRNRTLSEEQVWRELQALYDQFGNARVWGPTAELFLALGQPVLRDQLIAQAVKDDEKRALLSKLGRELNDMVSQIMSERRNDNRPG